MKFNISYLTNPTTHDKVGLVRAIREVMNNGLKEAKDIADSVEYKTVTIEVPNNLINGERMDYIGNPITQQTFMTKVKNAGYAIAVVESGLEKLITDGIQLAVNERNWKVAKLLIQVVEEMK